MSISLPSIPTGGLPIIATATSVVVGGATTVAAMNNYTHNRHTLQLSFDTSFSSRVITPRMYVENSIRINGTPPAHVQEMLKANFSKLSHAHQVEYKQYDFAKNGMKLQYEPGLIDRARGLGPINIVPAGESKSGSSRPPTASIQDAQDALQAQLELCDNGGIEVVDCGEVVTYSTPSTTITTYCSSQAAPAPHYNYNSVDSIIPVAFLATPLGMVTVALTSGAFYMIVSIFVQRMFLGRNKNTSAVEQSAPDKLETLRGDFESYKSAVESKKTEVVFTVNEPSCLEILTFYKTKKLSLNQAVFILNQAQAVTITAKAARQFLLDDLNNYL